jgi:hypothetical protein
VLIYQNVKHKVQEERITGNCPAKKGKGGKEGSVLGETIREGVDGEFFEMLAEENVAGVITWTAKITCPRPVRRKKRWIRVSEKVTWLEEEAREEGGDCAEERLFVGIPKFVEFEICFPKPRN